MQPVETRGPVRTIPKGALNQVIVTMRQTGKDMSSILARDLAVNVPEC